jgi:hypothetical protein
MTHWSSPARESCVVRGADNEDEYTFRHAEIDEGEPPLWVKRTLVLKGKQMMPPFACAQA